MASRKLFEELDMNEKDQEIVGVVVDIVKNKKAKFILELLAVIALLGTILAYLL